MNRESAQKLSDNDFWQICREMHSNTNYIFPASATIGVSNNNSFHPELEFFDRGILESMHNEEIVSSDDSLQNLYVKQTQAHRKLLSTNENSVDRQKILSTIESLSCNNENEQNQNCDDEKCKESDDIDITENSEQHNEYENNNEVDSMNNADDLLLSIADLLCTSIKANVNQIDKLNEKTSSNEFVVDPNSDLIDFSDDDWINDESDDIVNSSDKHVKKATHSSSEGNFKFL